MAENNLLTNLIEILTEVESHHMKNLRRSSQNVTTKIIHLTCESTESNDCVEESNALIGKNLRKIKENRVFLKTIIQKHLQSIDVIEEESSHSIRD